MISLTNLLRNKTVKLAKFQTFQAPGSLFVYAGPNRGSHIHSKLQSCDETIRESPKLGIGRTALFSNIRLAYAHECHQPRIYRLDGLSCSSRTSVLHFIVQWKGTPVFSHTRFQKGDFFCSCDFGSKFYFPNITRVLDITLYLRFKYVEGYWWEWLVFF